MQFKYLHYKSWVQTTREERQFCAALFGIVRKTPQEFIRLLEHEADSLRGNANDSFNGLTVWEMGFEVALGRDLCNDSLKCLGPYRKFDLVFFSKNHLVVVEAKAQQGFSSKEMNRYKSDKCQLKSALDVDVTFVGICSEHYYDNHRIDLSVGLDYILTWSKIAGHWPDEHFYQAESIYGK